MGGGGGGWWTCVAQGVRCGDSGYGLIFCFLTFGAYKGLRILRSVWDLWILFLFF